MTDVLDKKVFEDILWYLDHDDPLIVWYEPRRPRLNAGPDGQPVLSLLVSGEGGFLQCDARLDPPPDMLERLRTHLRTLSGAGIAAGFQLSPASLSLHKVELLLHANGEPLVLQESNSSGTFPFNAIFNAALTPEEIALVKSALSGRSDVLKIRYTVSMPAGVSVQGQLAGRLDHLPEVPSEQVARALVDQEIESGRLKLELIIDEGASEQLARAVQDRLITNATELLVSADSEAPVADPLDINLRATLFGQSSGRRQLETDLGKTMATHELNDFMTLSAAPLTPASLGTVEHDKLRVSLGFDPTDSPLVVIRVSSGEETVSISEPDYTPGVLVRPNRSEPVTVTVDYNDGTPQLEKSIDATDAELTLTEQDLGLVHVITDARPLADAGVKKARARISYSAGPGHETKEITQYFRNDKWVEHWWFPTVEGDAESSLSFEYKLTDADGKRVNVGPNETKGHAITLSLDH